MNPDIHTRLKTWAGIALAAEELRDRMEAPASREMTGAERSPRPEAMPTGDFPKGPQKETAQNRR